MPAKVTLEITEGPIKGQVFVFEKHDTFFLGRDVDCHARLSEDDPYVSRHHFILELNPPDACIRDLGSLNGTYVNGTKHGGREIHETPEDAKGRQYPDVNIKDGDEIKVGDTVFAVTVVVPAYCIRCGEEISDASKNSCGKDSAGNLTCPQCVEKERQSALPPPPPPPVRCSQCDKDASDEAGAGLTDGYVCQSCRDKVQADQIKILIRMIVAKRLRAGLPEGESRIPGYQVVKELGKGAFGAVYLAVRDKDQERVALKVMLAKVPVTEHAIKHFLREVEVTKTLNNPNIVACHDHGVAGSGFYFEMEFCEGGDVRRLMWDYGGKLPVDVARPIMLQSLAGLAYAHDYAEEEHYVHRDLKPENILLTAKRGGVAKIGDFGLAKNFDMAGFSGMTKTGTAAGTWDYMPEEQLLNYRFVKPVSDVWSMGATFYDMLTGIPARGPIPENQDPAKFVMETPAIPIRMRNATISKDLAAVIDKSLSSRPQDRYQDAGEFLAALKNVL